MAELLKDRYNESYLIQIADKIALQIPYFEKDAFLQIVYKNDWEDLALKARMRRISESVFEAIALPYEKAVEIVKAIAPVGDGLLDMWFPDFVELYGLEHWDISMQNMEYLTQFSSAEFAIRPFIKKDSKRAFKQLYTWSKHENHHVRRLASEGCRPRLPWGMGLPNLKKDPAPILPILKQLKDDSSEYVRRSVANNLNDIAKEHPNLVLKIAEKWIGANENRDKLVKHACRTLLKAGNTQAMLIFGFADPIHISINNLSCAPSPIEIGDYLHFNFDINNSAETKDVSRIEYAIDYVKKSGKTSRKVFKITENTYPKGITNIKRRQSFQDFTTRTHYPGIHQLSIIINGVEKATISFEVIKKPDA